MATQALSTTLSRRGILSFAAAAPIVALGLPAAARADSGLLALNARYLRDRDALNGAGLDEGEFELADIELLKVEAEIASAPCLSTADAQAKLLHAIRGFERGKTGNEADALRQVIEFLAGAH